jgi:hypothetical protein
MMVEQLDEAVKLLIVLPHRAAVLEDARLNALVNSYLAGFGTQTAGNRELLAKAFSERAPPSTASERIQDRIKRGQA